MKGRPRKPLDNKADAKAIRERLKDKGLEGWQRQRLQVAAMGLARERTLPEIAAEAGVHPRTVSTWLELLRSGGIEALVAPRRKGKGPASWLDATTAKELRGELKKGRWRRAEQAHRWLEEKLGRKLSLMVTYKYLGKCEARLKVPRPHHARQDPAAVETFRATLGAQLHAKDIPLETRVHLWVIDEMRFGLQPVTRRVWTLRGQEIVVPVEPRYQWGYTYGALEVCGDGAEFLHTDGVSQEATAAFYEQLGAGDPGAIHIVIADGAGFHLPEGHELLPENVRIITLPAYSPELNPIEKLWDIIKDRICNRVWADLETLQEAINTLLREYWANPKLVRSLVGEGLLSREANTSFRSVLVV